MSTNTTARQYRRSPSSPAYFIGRPASFWQRVMPAHRVELTRTHSAQATHDAERRG